jgi:hypothetical protein
MEKEACNERATTVQQRATAFAGTRATTPPIGGVARPRGTHVQPTWDQEWELLDETPSTWSGPHVGRRLAEAMRTLALLPMGAGSAPPAWPAYCYEWDDLLAQQAQGELERTQALQNRIRLLPSSREVQRMEQCVVWPAEYLARLVHLLRAVNAVALAHSLERDSGWIAAKRGGYADTWRERHDQGCSIIARGLRACRTPVF